VQKCNSHNTLNIKADSRFWGHDFFAKWGHQN
jgi:hypothetical protein